MRRSLSFRIFMGVLIASMLGAIGWKWKQDHTPLWTTGSDVPNAARAGDPAYAEQHTRELISLLRAHNWEPIGLPFEQLQLPDQKLAEVPFLRASNTTAYVFPSKTTPEMADIACYTTIYARYNRSVYRGDKTRSRPEGFYIVGWKDGRVERIPLDRIRSLPTSRGSWIPCFPGMAGYEKAQPNPMLSDR